MSKKKVLPPEKPRLQRHGVMGWLETTIGSCFCGAERWYAAINSVTADGSAHNVELNYPNCNRCLGHRSGQRAETYYNYGVGEYRDKTIKHRGLHTHEDCLLQIRNMIGQFTGKTPDFEPGIQAYMYYGSHTVRSYPHLATDYYWNLITYWPDEGTIRRHDTGEILIKFRGRTKREWDVNHFISSDAVLSYAVEIDQAYTEYCMDHNHRGVTIDDARGRLAWLLGEYLMDREHRFYRDATHVPDNIPGFRLASILQRGEWQSCA
jgi:hypothetical protein